MERSLVIIKPDGVQRGLIGEIVGRLERRGLRLAAMRFMAVEKPFLRALSMPTSKPQKRPQKPCAAC